MVSKAKKSFNWSGITDNYDGSFTADDKRAQKRLTREFHNQGFKSRSERLPDGRYRISPVGVKAFKKAVDSDPTLSAPSFGDEGPRAGRNPRTYSGARPRTRYARPRGYQYVRPAISGGYRPNYYGRPRVGPRLGTAIIQGARRYSYWKTKRAEEQAKERILRKERTEKNQREFAVAELNEQRAKRAMMVHRKPELATALKDAERRTEARISQGGGDREAPAIPKQPEPKRSSDAEVQKARQEYISGS